MAAITKRLLHLRINTHSSARSHPYPPHYFSSSSDPETPSDIPQPDLNPGTKTLPSFSSGFSDVKSRLQQGPRPENRHQIPRSPPASGADSNANIRRQLSEFRARTAAPPPSSSTDQFISLQELYERNVNAQGNSSAGSSGGKHSFNALRTSLRQINPGAQNDSSRKLSNQWSVSNQGSPISAGGNESFTPFFLRKETRGKDNSYLGSVGLSRMNDHLDLGKKLKALRPQNRKGKWFSLQELNDRLAKLRGAENQERDANHPKNVIASVRDGIKEIQESGRSKQMKNMNSQVQSIGFLGSIGGTESYNLYPPKTDLVEKYFHPDNMSSAEKLKLELKKVRDEFKMSESDCGSARVQVAQLTTKIKHLSTVLQKKDKHSRRGLLAMVQRRKKLLKYLRRTDWDSYCVVLSKLGLRDNPDIKA